jgi:hypothetical protein
MVTSTFPVFKGSMGESHFLSRYSRQVDLSDELRNLFYSILGEIRDEYVQVNF